MRVATLLATLLACASAGSALADLLPSDAIVEIRVNGQDSGPTLVVRRDLDGALLLRQADLVQLRLNTPSGPPLSLDGEPWYRIDPAMGAEVRFDQSTQTVSLTLPPSAFSATRTGAGGQDVPEVTPARLGGFLNYDLFAQRVSNADNLGGVVEAGAFGPRGVVTNTLIGQSDEFDSSLVRLDTTWRLDFPDRLETLRVGDAISTAGAWGRAARFGGVQYGTNFSTQPTLVTTPLLYAEGEAILQSTVDVFVNGQKVVSEAVPPGPFTIDRVPPVNGAGQIQVVVTDALGRQQVLSQPYYTGPSLLRAGLNEWSVEAGMIREDYGTRSNAYGDAVVSGTFRRGITDEFTAEVHAEGEAGGAAAVGLDAALQVGDLGIASVTAAAGGDGTLGWLAGAGIERNGPRFSVFARLRYASEDFAQLGTLEQQDRPKQLSFGGFGMTLGRYGNAQLSYGLQSYWTGPTAETVGLSHSVTLGKFGYLNFVASRTTGGDSPDEEAAADEGSSTSFFLGWTMPLGDRRTAGLALDYSPDVVDQDEFEATATLQESLPAGEGTGYFVSLSSSEDAQLEYYLAGRAGVAGLQYARRDGEDGWRLNASGGVAATSAGLMPARTLDESFAVVELAGYPELTVYLENQPVGRTDRKGRVLLDSLRPYESNAVSIDPRELPLDASLAMPDMRVTPAFRSGPVVRFPVQRASAATLRLLQGDGTPVPAGARVTTTSEEAPVALDGLVYLTSAAGRQEGVAEWPGHRCVFRFERPESADPVPDLGTIACATRHVSKDVKVAEHQAANP
jgi:outer membrane usher protein